MLDAVLPAYGAWLADLAAAGATAIQLDEPALVLDLTPAEVAGFHRAYARLRAAVPTVELTVASYFGALGPNLGLAVALPIDRLHVDLVRAPDQLAEVVAAAPVALKLSLGAVDGRNIWRSDWRSSPNGCGWRSKRSVPSACRWHPPARCCTCRSTSQRAGRRRRVADVAGLCRPAPDETDVLNGRQQTPTPTGKPAATR